MPVKKSKPIKKKTKSKNKHCPVCKESVSMSVAREADGENDLYWLICKECESSFALTRQEYQKEKQPDISAVEKGNAKTYRTDRKYKIGELIYHSKWSDLGWVVEKSSAPIAECSGAIVVSFMDTGLKTLIEGYKVA